jgi:hypothetical protein
VNNADQDDQTAWMCQLILICTSLIYCYMGRFSLVQKFYYLFLSLVQNSHCNANVLKFKMWNTGTMYKLYIIIVLSLFTEYTGVCSVFISTLCSISICIYYSENLYQFQIYIICISLTCLRTFNLKNIWHLLVA